MVDVASRLTFALEIPFFVGDFDVSDIRGIETKIGLATSFTDERAPGDGDIANHATITKREIDNVIVHTGLRLTRKKLAPMLCESKRCNHLTRTSSAAPSEGADGFLWKYFNHRKGRKQVG
jgi:hypothetical protein